MTDSDILRHAIAICVRRARGPDFWHRLAGSLRKALAAI